MEIWKYLIKKGLQYPAITQGELEEKDLIALLLDNLLIKSFVTVNNVLESIVIFAIEINVKLFSLK